MFCFSCQLFMKEEKYESKVAWRTVGVDNWKKGTEKIKEHKKTEAHMVSMVRWSNFKQRPLEEAFRRADMEGQARREEERQRNREIMRRLIDITLYLARQNGAFRGQNESNTSLNKGNFLELVQLLSNYDSIKMHLDHINKIHSKQKTAHVSLLSNRTQNDIISAFATYVRGESLKEMDESKTFSILLDETTDVSHVEQVVLCCSFCPSNGNQGEIFTVLEENGLKVEDIRGQGYDGAANMSGGYSGPAVHEFKATTRKLYMCTAMPTVSTSSWWRVPNQSLHTFLARSPKRHAAFVKLQQTIVCELKRLSDTRWAGREDALRSLKKVLSAVVKLLQNMADSDPPDSAAGDARRLLRSIDFEFILCMEITTPIFNETAIASAALQRKNLDLSASYTIVEGVIERVKAMRTDEEFKKGKPRAAGIEVPEEIPGQARRRKVPQKYNFGSKSATEDYQAQDLEEHYRGKVFFSFLDRLSHELHRRFKGKNDTPYWVNPIRSSLPYCLTSLEGVN
ncbi:Zinc finger MYM-type protein 1 [Merluccius polli]|uniref:Zinc finger MYM-type protein 1 n=1 Tax=Merluccius polli TaxID=89951 RepID=A0AA47MEW7_MERPO|nr:Zinc finger MYM-type protein 1 [Merluccius polli]